MKTTISNIEAVIDSRDIIKRIEYLESIQVDLVEQLSNGEISEADMLEFDKEERAELDTLRELAEQCEGAADWKYGEVLIHRDYFEEYMEEMVEDCYELPKNLPFWISIKIDYEALKQDYFSVDFNGQEYLIKN